MPQQPEPLIELERGRKLAIMFAMLVALLFAAMSQTIVTTALPQIMLEMGRLEDISWFFTVYILAAAIPALLIGNLSDLYGRKPFILLGLILFIIGSYLAGLAVEYTTLLTARLIQGLGGGAIMITAFSSVGDIFPPQERARWQGLLGSAFGLASLMGPLLGGYIVDHGHWSWVFWSAIPVGLLALLMLAVLLPAQHRVKRHRIDYFGALLMTMSLLPLLLAFSQQQERSILLLISLSSLFAFIHVERSTHKPILPLELFSNPLFSLSNIIIFAMGASIFAAIMYLPLYLQVVMTASASWSGLVLMLMTLSLVITSLYAGHYLSVYGGHKGLSLFGLTLISASMYMLSQLNTAASSTEVLAYIIFSGIGIGMVMPVFNLLLQNTVEHRHLGVATATGQLSRQLGSVIGVTYMGTLISQQPYLLNGNKPSSVLHEDLGAGLSEVFLFTSLIMLLAVLMLASQRERLLPVNGK